MSRRHHITPESFVSIGKCFPFLLLFILHMGIVKVPVGSVVRTNEEPATAIPTRKTVYTSLQNPPFLRLSPAQNYIPIDTC
jgi:hypothetical protein